MEAVSGSTSNSEERYRSASPSQRRIEDVANLVASGGASIKEIDLEEGQEYLEDLIIGVCIESNQSIFSFIQKFEELLIKPSIEEIMEYKSRRIICGGAPCFDECVEDSCGDWSCEDRAWMKSLLCQGWVKMLTGVTFVYEKKRRPISRRCEATVGVSGPHGLGQLITAMIREEAKRIASLEKPMMLPVQRDHRPMDCSLYFLVKKILRESHDVSLSKKGFYSIFEMYFVSPSHAEIKEFQALSEEGQRSFPCNLMGGVENAIKKGNLHLYPLNKGAVRSLFVQARDKILNGYRIVWQKKECMKLGHLESALSAKIERKIRAIVRDELAR